MEPTKLFENVIEYIDTHIEEPSDDIKKGFARKYGLDSNAFGKVFNFMTGDTLASYIRKRKLYFASIELRLEPTVCSTYQPIETPSSLSILKMRIL